MSRPPLSFLDFEWDLFDFDNDCETSLKPCSINDCDNQILDHLDYCLEHSQNCSFIDCLAKAQRKDEMYCSSHSQECSVDSCSQRISDEDNYCDNHKEYDKYLELKGYLLTTLNRYIQTTITETDIIQILGSSDNFSFSRGKTCLELNCEEKIGTCFQSCFRHKKLCQVRGCTSNISYLGDYCYWHLKVSLQDCVMTNCNNQAVSPEIYCQQHGWVCQHPSCSTRFAYSIEGSVYCSQHQGLVCQVDYCSEFKGNNGYCLKHRNVCGESDCNQRIEHNYCSNHHKPCREENCSQRISLIEDYCLAHQVRTCRNCSKGIGKPKKREWICAEPEIKEYNERMDSLCSDCGADFILNTCEVLKCEIRVVKGQQKHCSQHAYQCNYWSGDWHCYDRTSSQYGYCDNHNQTCLSCSTHICKDIEYYCSEHQNSCANCSTRIAYNKSRCASCQQQRTEQNQLKALVQQKTSLTNPQEVIRFSAWWNNNLATVINDYWVFFLVYDKEDNKVRVFPANTTETKWGTADRSQHSSLSGAKEEAEWLREKLKYDSNPILVIRPSDNYVSFREIVGEPYVIEKEISLEEGTYTYYTTDTGDWFRDGYETTGRKQMYPTNPSVYLKPLDIVWIKRIHRSRVGITYYHVGIYLGYWDNNYWMCHLDGDNKGVEIITWGNFVKEEKDQDCSRELIRFHPIIPFKDYREISEQINWAADKSWQNGNYCLMNRNCEHAANSLVLGINYSKQVYDKPFGSGFCFKHLFCRNEDGSSAKRGNNDKGSTICLSREIQNTNDKISKFHNQTSQNIKEQYEKQIVAPIKTSDCRIM